MNSIKINITLPKANELKSDLNTLLNQVQSKTSLNLDLDITSFKTSIGEVSQMLGKLKSQVSSLGGFENLINANMVKDSTEAIERQNNAIREQQKLLDERVIKTSNTKIANSNGEDVLIKDLEQIRDEYGNIIEVVNNYNSKTGEVTSTIVKTTNEVEKQRIANEKLLESTEKVKDAMQSKLNQSISNKNFTLIDDFVFTSLQQKINSINTETPEREIRELQNALKNLNNSDSQIVRLQNAISKYETKIDGLKEKYKNLVPKNELNEAINKIGELKNVLSQVQSSEGAFTNKAISNTLNEASTSMNKLGTATKIASENQKLYNKEVTTFSTAFKDVATKVGLFSVVYTAMNEVQNAFREGFQSVISMDDALTDLAKVVDLNQQQLLSMRNSAVAMGEALGRSSIDVAKAQAEFGRQYKDISQINEMTRVSILGANVMDGTSADEVAKGLTTIISSLKLETNDAINVIDSLNEVQNNYRVSASSMLNALAEVGSTAKVAGADIYQLQGYITAMTVATGKSGDEIGNSLRSITSRIYKIGSEGIESEGKPEQMLQDMGVAVRDLNGEFRPLNEILSDLNVKWKTMSETQKIGTAQVVAGVHRYNDFISLMNNFEMAIDSSATAMNSMGSATKENEIYLNSISGRMESLKASTEGFWMDFISSDMIKGGVDSLRSLMNALNMLQNTFGSLGLSIGTLSTGFLMLTNNPLRQLSQDLIFHKTTLGGLSDIYTKIKYAVAETGASMNITQKSSLALRTGFTQLGNSAVFAQLKVIALQSVLSLGLGFAITLVISGFTKLVSSLNSSGKSMDDVKTQADALAGSLDSVSKERDLTKQYENISKQLQDANLEENKRNDLKKQLDSIMKDLIASEQGYYGILNNENLTLDQQIEKMEQVRQTRLFDEAKELDKDMMSQNDIEDKVSRLNGYIQTYKDLQEAINAGNNQRLIDLIGVSDIDEANQILGDTKNKINELDSEIIKYNSGVKLMSDSNYETSRSMVDLDNNTNNFIGSLNKSTKALEENLKVKQDNANVNNLGGEVNEVSVEQATQNYGKAVEEVEKLDTLLQKINKEQQLTPDIVAELAKNYSDLGGNITDINAVQQYLNDKIQAQVAIQQEAYQIMRGNDESYYNDKIKNSAEAQDAFNKFASEFVDVNSDTYNFDLKNFRSLNEAKAGFINQLSKPLSEFLSNLLGGSADTYRKELQNTKNYAEAKAYILAKLDEQISKAENRLNSFAEKSVQSATSIDALNNEKFATKALQQIKTIQTERVKIETSFNDFYASFNTSVPTFGTGSSLIGKDMDKNKDKAEKLAENLKDLRDRYYEVNNALKQLDNELEKNKTLMENANEKEKINYLGQQLQIIQKQISAQKNLRKEQERELSELRNGLTANGFGFAGDGTVTNYSNRLKALTDWANSIADNDTKENAKDNVEQMAKNLERYTSLLLDEIPDVNNELLELQNTASKVNDEIKAIYREKLETVADVESQISDLIKKNVEERIESEKKALEKSMENDRKRIESKKKALKDEQELYNKQYSEDNYEAELNEERNKLLQLQADIDKLQFANDRKSQVRLEELIKNYEAQQKLINDKIAEHQNQAINDRFEQEQELIDKELEDKENAYDDAIAELDKKLENFLSPQNLTNLVSSAMKSGFVDVLGQTVNLNDAMNEMFRDTEVGIANLNLQYNDWLTNLNSIKDTIFDINGYMNGAGLSSRIDLSAVRSLNPQPISIDMGGITVQGNVDKDVLPDLDRMFKKQQDEIINIINKRLSGTR